MEARLLGPVEVLAAGRPVDLGRGKALSLMAILLVHAGTSLPVERLLDLLWNGAPPPNGRASLQVYVSRLRSRLANAPSAGIPARSGNGSAQSGNGRAQSGIRIVTRGDSYVAEIEAGDTDLICFRRLIDEARRVEDPHTEATLLTRAVDLWRGEALTNVDQTVRDRLGRALQEELLAACERRAEVELTLGHHAEHVPVLAELVEAHPFRQRLVWCLMLALYRSGRPTEALEHYHKLARQIGEKHGTDPGSELAKLHRQILNADPALRLSGRVRHPANTPHQLPSPPQHFTGREAALVRLRAALLPGGDPVDAAVGAGDLRTTRTAVISGSGGSGKTSLALYWAQQHLDYFPDGQLYVDLRGFGPVADPKDSAATVRELLRTLGVNAAQIPAEPDAQAALYRSRLAGRSMLLVLDNARDAAQVRALLPGSRGCAVIITSRNPLGGLIATQGAIPVALRAMGGAEARDMMIRRIGSARVTAEPDAVDRILRDCACLPLALALTAARLAISSALSLREVAAELERGRGGLDAFSSEDPATDVRTVFSWSYRTLSARAAQLFRLLSHHTGPTITVDAAASLAGLPVDRTVPLLVELVSSHLLAERRPGEYAMHDLIAAYAAELDRAIGGADERDAAVDRLLHHYLHSTLAASDLAFPSRDPLGRPTPPAGVSVAAMHSRDDAVEWFEACRPVLLAAVTYAAARGHTEQTWRLAWAIVTFLDRDGRWWDIAATHRVVLAAAARAGDRLGEAYAHRALCRALTLLCRPDQALAHAAAALTAYSALGDALGMAAVRYDMSIALWRADDASAAAAAGEEALRLYRTAGHRAGEIDALNATSWYHTLLGDHDEALRFSTEALDLARHGPPGQQASILDTLGHLHHQRGDHVAAIDCYRRALALQSELGDRYEESMVLTHLGDTHQALDRPDRAAQAWLRAIAILSDLRHPDAETVRERLASL